MKEQRERCRSERSGSWRNYLLISLKMRIKGNSNTGSSQRWKVLWCRKRDVMCVRRSTECIDSQSQGLHSSKDYRLLICSSVETRCSWITKEWRRLLSSRSSRVNSQWWLLRSCAPSSVGRFRFARLIWKIRQVARRWHSQAHLCRLSRRKKYQDRLAKRVWSHLYSHLPI